MGCLYQIQFPNGKKYIGISKLSAEKRFHRHIKAAEKGSNLIIHNAIRKYGKENCKAETLIVANDYEYLKDLEIRAIKRFNTVSPFGYNCTSGGEGIFNIPMVVKKKMSRSASKRASSLEGKRQLSLATKQLWASPEKKKKIIDALQTKESRKKQSITLKKKFKNKEEYNKLIDRFNSPERKKKISESAKKQWSDPEKRARILSGLRRRKNAIQ